MNESMTVQDAIEIMRGHVERWCGLMAKADRESDYHNAQSYKDMIYAVRAMIMEIERELYKEERD